MLENRWFILAVLFLARAAIEPNRENASSSAALAHTPCKDDSGRTWVRFCYRGPEQVQPLKCCRILCSITSHSSGSTFGTPSINF
jgi:hypothetical protein